MNRISSSRRTVGTLAALFGTALAFNGAPAHAQQTEIDALRQQLAELQARLDKLETTQKDTAAAVKAAAPSVTSSSKVPLVVSGLAQLQSLNYLDEDIHTGGANSRDTFRLRRGEVRVTAPAITSRLSATVMFDLARSSSTNVAASNNGTNILQDLQGTYQFKRSPKGNLFLDLGQFKTPIGYEAALVGSSALPFLERSLIFTGRDNVNSTYGDQRDIGLQARAVYPQFEARVGIFNGFGDRQNNLSLSDNKAVIGLLAFKPQFVPGLTLGVSGGTGNTGISTTVGTPATSINSNVDRDILNAFLAYKKNKFGVQGEYLRGNSDAIIVGANTVAARDVEGYYLGGSYSLTPRLELLARYDHLDTNRDVNDAAVTDYLIGANYYIKGNNAKLQVNLVKRNGGDNAPNSVTNGIVTNPASNYRNDRLELRTGLQLAF